MSETALTPHAETEARFVLRVIIDTPALALLSPVARHPLSLDPSEWTLADLVDAVDRGWARGEIVTYTPIEKAATA